MDGDYSQCFVYVRHCKKAEIAEQTGKLMDQRPLAIYDLEIFPKPENRSLRPKVAFTVHLALKKIL